MQEPTSSNFLPKNSMPTNQAIEIDLLRNMQYYEQAKPNLLILTAKLNVFTKLEFVQINSIPAMLENAHRSIDGNNVKWNHSNSWLRMIDLLLNLTSVPILI